MTRGWTGGQYSLVRGLVAIAAFVHITVSILAGDPPPGGNAGAGGLLILSAIGALMLAVGALDRPAALMLTALHIGLNSGPLLAGHPGEIALGLALLIHLAVPKAVYGSWAARGRADPGNGWRLPATASLSAWAGLMAVLALSLHAVWPGLGWLAALALPLAWAGRQHPLTWAAMLTAALGLPLLGPGPASLAPVLLLGLLAFDPAWIPPRRQPAQAMLFFDGDCALCHGTVRFLLAEDRRTVFTFSPIGGDAFTKALSADTIAGLPDSMLLLTDRGDLLMKSDAVITCLHMLGGLWRMIGLAFSILPKPLRDAGYDMMGQRRYALFGKKTDHCPIMTPEQRRRFQV